MIGRRWTRHARRLMQMAADAADDRHAFARAVEAVRGGSAVEDEAQSLYRRLTDEERLWLRAGDTEFWAGLAGMFSGGFNEHPFGHGEMAPLGVPSFRFSDDAL